MKIGCECGSLIIDTTDNLPWKAHFISDKNWFDFQDSIDEAIEKSDPVDRTNKVTFSNSIGRIQLERIVQNPVV